MKVATEAPTTSFRSPNVFAACRASGKRKLHSTRRSMGSMGPPPLPLPPAPGLLFRGGRRGGCQVTRSCERDSMYRSLAPVPLPLLLLYRAAYAAASALAPLLVLRLSPLLLLSLADRLRLFIDGGGVGDDCGRVAMVASSAMTRAKRERCPRRLLPAADVDPVAGVGDGKEDVVFGVVVGLAVMPSAFDGRDASTRCHRPRFILPRRSVRLVEDGGWPLDDDDPGPDVAVGSLAGTSPPLNGPVLLPLLPPVPPPPLLLFRRRRRCSVGRSVVRSCGWLVRACVRVCRW
mmetsp:Transcript_2196/g.7865  ORF Transcript_2196/g.7865 Transcript_2196/m.7865 type:complete len:290 (-) Transcript_2196:17-886(-)